MITAAIVLFLAAVDYLNMFYFLSKSYATEASVNETNQTLVVSCTATELIASESDILGSTVKVFIPGLVMVVLSTLTVRKVLNVREFLGL